MINTSINNNPIKFIKRDKCAYNPKGKTYKEILKKYKNLPEEDKILSGGFKDIQMSHCYRCDYCQKWGYSKEEEKEIKQAINRNIEEEYY